MCNTVLQDTQSFNHYIIDMHGKNYLLLGSNTGTACKAPRSDKSAPLKARQDKTALRSKSLSLPSQSVFNVRPVSTTVKSER